MLGGGGGEEETCSVKTAGICPRPKGIIGWTRCQPQCQGKGPQSHQGLQRVPGHRDQAWMLSGLWSYSLFQHTPDGVLMKV